jgi:6-phosphogluconolactonase
MKVVVHPDARTLAAATAARMLLRLLDCQSTHRPVHLVVTGGQIGIKVLEQAATSPLRDVVDWSGVHVWWGDERFLPAGDQDRNETQARVALLDALRLPESHVHPIPGPDTVDSPEAAATRYAQELADAATTAAETDDAGPPVPAFDLLLLGVGPDGHTASLFPGHDTVEVADLTVVGVHDAPKPPAERVSLTLPALECAQEIWVVVTGEDKAAPVSRALTGDDVRSTPAAGIRARGRTLWLLDAQAAG